MPLFPVARSFDALSLRYGTRYKWLAMLVVALGTIAGVLSTSSFNVAVPALTRAFALGQEQVQRVMTGFMGAMTVSMLPAPWLLERLGFRKLFLGAVLALLVTSIAGYLAPTFPLVVAARIAQGIATGVLQPLGPLAVMRLFPPESQGRASGILTFGIVLMPAIAPAAGGALLDAFGWRTIFLLNLPFCVAAMVLALIFLPLPREIRRPPFDWSGVAMLTLATLVLVEVVSSLRHSGLMTLWTAGLLALAAVAIVFFLRHARRSKNPVISLGLFHHRAFSMGTIVSFAYGFGFFGSTYLIPVFLQNALGFSAAAAGSMLIPSGIALLATIPVAGRLADRLPPHWLTVSGMGLLGTSFLAFALFGGGITSIEIIGITVWGRIGLGLILPALTLSVLRHLEPHQLGQSSVVISYSRQLGGVLGIAVIAVFVAWRESVYGSSVEGIHTSYAQGFLLLAAVFALALTAALRMKPPHAYGR